MGSSEVSDYGRFAGGGSNFSHRANRLVQYLKEKSSFGDLSLGLSRNFVPSGNPRPTMDLLPMIEKSGQNSVQKPMNLFPTKEEAAKKMVETSVAKGGQEKAQMTIFYGGKVIVFNDFPADKAKEIMLLASSNGGSNTTTTTLVAPKLAESPPPAVPKVVVPCFGNQISTQQIDSELPIARKKSLARFLEKRKDRIVSKGPYPYQMSSPNAGSSSQAEESKGWLGLGAHFPVKIEH